MECRVRNFMPVFIKKFMLLKMLKYSRIPINISYKAYLNLIIVKFVVVNLSKEFILKVVYYYVIAYLESDLGLFERSLVSELLLFSRRTTNANACDMRSK